MSTKPTSESRERLRTAVAALTKIVLPPFLGRGELSTMLLEVEQSVEAVLMEAPPYPAAPADAGDANLTRYDYSEDPASDYAAIIESDNGEYVKYEDHAAAIAAARRLLDAPPGAGERTVHRSKHLFVALCGSDTHCQATTEVDEHVTCLSCLKLMSQTGAAPAPAEGARAYCSPICKPPPSAGVGETWKCPRCERAWTYGIGWLSPVSRGSSAGDTSPAPHSVGEAEAAMAKAGEWISVKERLPERNRTVLYWHKGYSSAGYLAIADEWHDEDHLKYATHWMDPGVPPAPLASSATAGSVATGEGGK